MWVHKHYSNLIVKFPYLWNVLITQIHTLIQTSDSTVCVEFRTTYRGQFSPSTIWHPGIELESSGLAGTTFTHKASYQFKAQYCGIFSVIFFYLMPLCVCLCTKGVASAHEDRRDIRFPGTESQMLGLKPCSSATEASSLNYWPVSVVFKAQHFDERKIQDL